VRIAIGTIEPQKKIVCATTGPGRQAAARDTAHAAVGVTRRRPTGAAISSTNGTFSHNGPAW
jgi:hypothetical protein